MSRKRKDQTRGGFLKLKDTKEYVESRQLPKEGYLQEVRVELGGNTEVRSTPSMSDTKGNGGSEYAC